MGYPYLVIETTSVLHVIVQYKQMVMKNLVKDVQNNFYFMRKLPLCKQEELLLQDQQIFLNCSVLYSNHFKVSHKHYNNFLSA